MEQPSTEAIISTIGSNVRIQGKIVSDQDLHVNGELEGSIDLHDCRLTIGPQAKVKAEIKARSISIVGSAEGTIEASERVELCSQCHLLGDIRTPRIVIKEGAFFKGTVDVVRPAPILVLRPPELSVA
jgi:cytoskeletal protein CcmA (bactofilin family)